MRRRTPSSGRILSWLALASAEAESDLAQLRARQADAERDAAHMLAALRRLGLPVSRPADIEPLARGCPAAAAVLLEWLPRVSTDDAKLSIVRALGAMRDNVIIGALLAELSHCGADEFPRTARQIAHLAGRRAGDDCFDAIAAVAGQTRDPAVRGALIRSLGRMKARAADAECVLDGLLARHEMAADALHALGRLKAVQARGSIAPYLSSPDAAERRAARKSIERLDRAAAREAP